MDTKALEQRIDEHDETAVTELKDLLKSGNLEQQIAVLKIFWDRIYPVDEK